jgi:YD repeat-containing protein
MQEQGSDSEYQVQMLGVNPANSYGRNPVVVSDYDGLAYVFPMTGQSFGSSDGGDCGSSCSLTMMPSQIIDRHGNTFSFTSPDGTYSTALQYTDSQGRAAVSMTRSANADILYTYGMQEPYKVNVTGNLVNYETNPLILNFTAMYPTPSNGTYFCGPLEGTDGTLVHAMPSAGEVTSIVLPNGDQYTFQYDTTNGMITKLIYPNGGYISYEWGIQSGVSVGYFVWLALTNIGGGLASTPNGAYHLCQDKYDRVMLRHRYVSYDGANIAEEQDFSYVYPSNALISLPQTTVVTNDMVRGTSFKTVYNYTSFPSGSNGYADGRAQACPVPQSACSGVLPNYMSTDTSGVPVEQSRAEYGTDGSLLRTETTTWYNQYEVKSKSVQLGSSSGNTSTTTYQYAPGFTSSVLGSQLVTEKDENDSSTTPATTRSTLTSYQTSLAGPSMPFTVNGVAYSYTAPIIDRVATSKVTTGGTVANGATLMAETDFSNFNSAGDAQTVTALCLQTNCPGNSVTTYAYNSSGQITSVTDPRKNTTTYSYTDSPTNSGWAGGTNAYLTNITYPLNESRSFKYDYSIGSLTQAIDENGQATVYCYTAGGCKGSSYEALLRPTEVDYPDGGQTVYSYTDGTSPSVTESQLIYASNPLPACTSAPLWKTTVTSMDGIGHAVRSQLTSTCPADTISTETTYDGDGQIYTVTNPHRASAAATDGTVTYAYDAIGRKTQMIDSDGVSTQQWSYSGNVVSYTDEDQNQRKRTSDAFGRLLTVLEPSAISQSPTMETDYTYDAVSNLLSVKQNGLIGSDIVRTRSFAYDSLSRLLTATNPETGTMGYTYDANGNVITKTDARSVITSYTYDLRNRLLSKSYSGDAGSTPWSCYQYSLASVTNGVGRLSNAWTQSASAGQCAATAPTSGFWTKRSVLAYDSMGRVQSEQQKTPSNKTYAPQYTYDFAGNLFTSTDGTTPSPTSGGSPLQFTYTVDGAGRLQAVTSNWSDVTTHPADIFSAQTGPASLPCPTSSSLPYAAFGGLMNAAYGNALTLNRAYDSQLRITCEGDIGTK